MSKQQPLKIVLNINLTDTKFKLDSRLKNDMKSQKREVVPKKVLSIQDQFQYRFNNNFKS